MSRQNPSVQDPATLDIMDSQLQFQNFSNSSGQHVTFMDDVEDDFNSSNANSRLLDEKPLLDDDNTPKPVSFWSVDFFQRLFDVDTVTVLKRLQYSMLPRVRKSFLKDSIGGKPDLYGPFWICTTLVFLIAIGGNLSNYLQSGSAGYHWRYDFHAVTVAAIGIFSYAWLLPLGLWAILRWMGTEEGRISLVELICVYGYALTSYLPVSILWLVQNRVFQWIAVIAGACLSGFVIGPSLWPSVSQTGNRRLVLFLIILALNALLGASFMLYFFHVPPSMPTGTVPTTSIAPNATSAHS